MSADAASSAIPATGTAEDATGTELQEQAGSSCQASCQESAAAELVARATTRTARSSDEAPYRCSAIEAFTYERCDKLAGHEPPHAAGRLFWCSAEELDAWVAAHPVITTAELETRDAMQEEAYRAIGCPHPNACVDCGCNGSCARGLPAEGNQT